MTTQPVVYRSDFLSSCDEIKILQAHLERLDFASHDTFYRGIDASTESGWLIVEDSDKKEIRYVSEGWEERIMALEPGCDRASLWEALGDSEARILEIQEEIENAFADDDEELEILPYKTAIGDKDWAVPAQWVRSVLNF